MTVWVYAAKRPAVYAFAAQVAVRMLNLTSGRDRRIRSLPIGGGWTVSRDFPAPSGKTFRELYRARHCLQRSTRE